MMYFRAELDNNTDLPKKNCQKELMGGKEKREKARLGGLKRDGGGGEKRLDARKEVQSKCDLASDDLSSRLQLNGSRGGSLHRAQVSASDSQALNSVTRITAHGDSH